LIREGFDPAIVTDPLLLRDPSSGDYRLIDHSLHARLVEGAIRL
jgi:fatty-acyl-CoA synthase